MHGFLAGIFSGNSLSDLKRTQGQCMKGGFNQGFLLMSRLPNVYYHLLGGLACVQLVDILKKLKKINVFMVKTKILNYFFIISLKPQHKKLMRKTLFEFINTMFIEKSSKGNIICFYLRNFMKILLRALLRTFRIITQTC